MNILNLWIVDIMARVAREPSLSGDDQATGANDLATLRDAVQAGKVNAASRSKPSEQQRDADALRGFDPHGDGDGTLRNVRAPDDRQPPEIRLIERALKTAGWSRSEAKRDAPPMWRYEKGNHV